MDFAPLTGEIDDDDLPMSSGLALMNEMPNMGDEQDPVERLKALISERQTETVEILRNWLEEKEGEAR